MGAQIYHSRAPPPTRLPQRAALAILRAPPSALLRHAHCLCTLVLLFAALVAPVAARAGEPAPFAQPRANLFTGGQPTARQLATFAADGVRTVIDLRAADEPRGYDEAAVAGTLELRYVALPIADTAALTAANAAALQRALAASEGAVLLHCASGNRVGALLALMAAEQEGISAETALDLGQRAGLKSLQPLVRERLGLGPAPRSTD